MKEFQERVDNQYRLARLMHNPPVKRKLPEHQKDYTVAMIYAEELANRALFDKRYGKTQKARVEEAIRIRNRNPDDFFSSKYWPQVPGPDKYVNQEGVLMMFITEFHNKRMVT